VPKPLAEIVIDAGLASREAVVAAAREAEQRREPLVVPLVRSLGVDELALLAAIRRQTRLPVADPAGLEPDPDAARLLPGELCRRLRVLPLAVPEGPGAALRLGVADPTDAVALAEVEQVIGGEVEPVALPLSTVEELVDRAFRGLVTQLLPKRRPFGDGVVPTTQPHAHGLAWSAGGVGEDTAVTRTTLPHRAVDDVELRLRALVGLLERTGVLAAGELDAAVAALRVGAGPAADDELTPPPVALAVVGRGPADDEVTSPPVSVPPVPGGDPHR
jgi:hypothetical protein